MSIKQSVGVGFSLAMVAAVMWGTVPIAVQQLLTDMDPYTIVWYRFLISAIGLGLILHYKKQLPDFQLVKSPKWIVLFLVATIGLSGNFVLFSEALNYLSPTTAQIIAQLSVIGLMLASTLILKERLRVTQLIGIIVLFIGLLLFFNRGLIEIFTRLTDYTLGVLLGSMAALIWVMYGIAQKVLLNRLKSQQILWVLYVLCTLLFLPVISPSEVLNLSAIQLCILIYCGANTVVAYGALAEAMNRWQVAQVSAIVTLTPLFTLFFSDLLAVFFPEKFAYPALNILGYIGAFVVVAGAMTVAVGHYFWQVRNKKV